MKLTCSKNELQRALSVVEKNTGKNLTLPILNSILFETKENNLVLKATNLDICVEVKIKANIKKGGITALPSQTIVGYINAISSDSDINLELIGENVSITSDENSTIIKTIPSEDYPPTPKVSSDKTFTISSKQLVNGIKSVVYSASNSDVKPEISSVYLYHNNMNAIFVATDSFRLAEKKIVIKSLKNIEPILIPFRNAVELVRIFDLIEEEIVVHIDKNLIALNGSNIYITSRLTEGVFPNYQQIITNVFKTEITIEKQDLINALKISSVFSDNFSQISINIIPEDGIIEIESKNQETGENISKIKGNIKGEAISISFNQRYINECLQVIKDDKISIKLNGIGKPIVVTSIQDNSFLYLIMPMTR